jgi:hypothetical protein
MSPLCSRNRTCRYARKNYWRHCTVIAVDPTRIVSAWATKTGLGPLKIMILSEPDAVRKGFLVMNRLNER